MTDPQYFPCKCPVCEWHGMSNEAEGGEPMADTGDYSDLACPICSDEGHFFSRVDDCTPEELEDYRENKEPWLVISAKWSESHSVAWWRTDQKGYTSDLSQAGQYTRKEAMQIERACSDRDNKHAIAIPLNATKELTSPKIIDLGWEKNREILKEYYQ